MWAELNGFISRFCAAFIPEFLPCWVISAVVVVHHQEGEVVTAALCLLFLKLRVTTETPKYLLEQRLCFLSQFGFSLLVSGFSSWLLGFWCQQRAVGRRGGNSSCNKSKFFEGSFTILQPIPAFCLACDKMLCCGICLEQGFAWIIVPCNVHMCAGPLPVLHGTPAPLWRRICVLGCSDQQKPSAWGKEGCSDKTKMLK